MIELESVPELVDPVMVAAFEGWNDAGDAASTAVAHLDREWKGEVFAALDAEDYYDFQVNRPTVWLDGGTRKITWPTTRLSVVRVGGEKPRDLVLVRGIEPSMRWRSFCNEILGFAHELGVEMVVILGALLGDTPHTRPVPVSGVTSDADLARTMDLEETRYEGPTGIVGVLQEACTHAGVTHGQPVGGGSALRVAAAEPQGDAGPAEPPGGPDRSAHPAGRTARGRAGLAGRRGPTGLRGQRGRGVRADAGGGAGHRGAARGVRRGHRPGVRALSAAAGRRPRAGPGRPRHGDG